MESLACPVLIDADDLRALVSPRTTLHQHPLRELLAGSEWRWLVDDVQDQVVLVHAEGSWCVFDRAGLEADQPWPLVCDTLQQGAKGLPGRFELTFTRKRDGAVFGTVARE